MPDYLITNARILDATGREPFSGAVRVEGHRIAAVTPGAAPPPEGAVVIDARGGTLMPGLVESHAHIGLADLPSPELTRLPVEEHMLITVRNARTKLLGFSHMDAIVAATRLGGELMGRPGELGVIAPGALADLLLVEGDPLADIEILQDRGALLMIMLDGALHKGPAHA
jgi:imidazolonepropionase-like amidohydrolase